MSDPHLFIGSVDFSDPTLLISGDAKALVWLADQIVSRHIAMLRNGHPAFVISELSVTLIPVEGAGGLDIQTGKIEWRISNAEAVQFAEQLRVLAEALLPAHAYLDTNSPLQVVASKGEYDYRHFLA